MEVLFVILYCYCSYFKIIFGKQSLRFKLKSICPLPTPGNLPNPGIEPESPASPALAGRFFTTSTTWEALVHVCMGF